MSASRDKTQRTTFVYSNLYQLYRKGKSAAESAQVPPQDSQGIEEKRSAYFQLPGNIPTSGNVLKAQDLKSDVKGYRPPTFINKRVVERPATQVAALQSLKGNLKTLNDLHSRLRFMLEELEDLIKT